MKLHWWCCHIIRERTSGLCTEWMECNMSHRKRRETEQQPSMTPVPAVPGCCLVSFHFLCDIHSIHSVCKLLYVMQSALVGTNTIHPPQAPLQPPTLSGYCCVRIVRRKARISLRTFEFYLANRAVLNP